MRKPFGSMESSEAFEVSPLKASAEKKTRSLRIMIGALAIIPFVCLVGFALIPTTDVQSNLFFVRISSGTLGLVYSIFILLKCWLTKGVFKPDYSEARTELESLAANVYNIQPEIFYQLSLPQLRDAANAFLEREIHGLVALRGELNSQLKNVTIGEIQDYADELCEGKWQYFRELRDRLEKGKIIVGEGNTEEKYSRILAASS